MGNSWPRSDPPTTRSIRTVTGIISAIIIGLIIGALG